VAGSVCSARSSKRTPPLTPSSIPPPHPPNRWARGCLDRPSMKHTLSTSRGPILNDTYFLQVLCSTASLLCSAHVPFRWPCT
jgi:hypothetical protein